MTLKDDAFPSSAAFDLIHSALSSSPTERAEALKSGKAIFGFTLKNPSGATADYHIDLKEKGTVGKGLAPEGAKPTVTITLSDADFAKLVEGKANAQSMFMSGKLKVKGNVMAAQRLGPVLQKAQRQGDVKAKL